MGLGSFLRRVSGGSSKGGGDAFCFVFGADKRFYCRNMESQGSHLQDNANRLAYFSAPEANGVLSRQYHGVTRTLGPVSVAYEPITELYGFPHLGWLPDRNNQNGHGSDGRYDVYEEDEILNNSWAQGFSLAAQAQENTEARNRLMTILLLAVLGATAMFLLVAASTGLLNDLMSGLSGFFK
jgi:hypothetical protein